MVEPDVEQLMVTLWVEVYVPAAGLKVGVATVASKVNSSLVLVDEVPKGVVTVMSTSPADSEGEVAVICESEITVNDVADVEPNVRAVARVNPLPVMVTDVPPAMGPKFGLTSSTAGPG